MQAFFSAVVEDVCGAIQGPAQQPKAQSRKEQVTIVHGFSPVVVFLSIAEFFQSMQRIPGMRYFFVLKHGFR